MEKYSKYAIRQERGMTLGQVVMLIALAAIVVAVGASFYGVSPWLIAAAACVPTAVVLVLAERELNEPCGHPGMQGASGRVFELGLGASWTLWVAAAFASIVEGVRLARSGEPGAAFVRFLACPLISVLAGAIVLFAGLFAALHCIN
jgi:hypothetical protein